MKKTFRMTVVGNLGQGDYDDEILMRAILNTPPGKVPDKDICVVAKEAAYLKDWYPAVNLFYVAIEPTPDLRPGICGGTLNNKRYRTKYLVLELRCPYGYQL